MNTFYAKMSCCQGGGPWKAAKSAFFVQHPICVHVGEKMQWYVKSRFWDRPVVGPFQVPGQICGWALLWMPMIHHWHNGFLCRQGIFVAWSKKNTTKVFLSYCISSKSFFIDMSLSLMCCSRYQNQKYFIDNYGKFTPQSLGTDSEVLML